MKPLKSLNDKTYSGNYVCMVEDTSERGETMNDIGVLDTYCFHLGENNVLFVVTENISQILVHEKNIRYAIKSEIDYVKKYLKLKQL